MILFIDVLPSEYNLSKYTPLQHELMSIVALPDTVSEYNFLPKTS